jgi:hypothetical protein
LSLPASSFSGDAAALFGGSLLPPALRDELWLSIGATGRRELMLRTPSAPRGWSVVAGLTIVVADLCEMSTRYMAQFGCVPLAIDPAEMDEAGLAQRFTLGPCWLTLLTPADDTAAGKFLAEHGPGLYSIALRDEVGDVAHSARVIQC